MITNIINGLISVLLIGAIGYTYLMDLKVRKLLAALQELEPMVGQFSKAVQQSETSLKKFKQATTATKPQVKPTSKLAKNADENNLTFETNRKSAPNYVGRISLTEKSDLVRSFFETAGRQEL